MKMIEESDGDIESLKGTEFTVELKKYILVDVVTWVAWYNRYFEITEEEYNSFGTEVLDNTADLTRWVGSSGARGRSGRIICG